MAKVLIADDHPVFRRALGDIVGQLLPSTGLAVVEAADRTQLFEIVENDDVDLILLDLCMPGMTGLPELVAIRNIAPATPVVIISAIDDTTIVNQAINCGAAGFIPKSSSMEDLAAALKQVLDGGVYIPGSDEAREKRGPAEADALTPRQLAVLGLLSAGKSNKEIARALSISDLTVKVHITTIFRKLGVATRTQAIVAFQRERAQVSNN
ncbi:two component transcriptional regulator, LuxR family [Methylocella silvestris BL2]|uniref:Two component transcriptional regulator, LuxR family n=1 Tax=Methylocella silvestris (strain DSM 15510 / CIP 108128 / LMG 27833 / NCIMB 13906 / BL2) TaxID=395965 RepID=B8EIF2_METSB|nr:response regulator transcription factor [Methylocella silvestris]ACK51271.1 two component transcriptional regulator, LuxR family [Methylocella silvestris BL2]